MKSKGNKARYAIVYNRPNVWSFASSIVVVVPAAAVIITTNQQFE